MKKKKIIIIVVLLVFSIIGNGNFLMQNQSLKEKAAEKEAALYDAKNQLTQLQSSVTDLQTQVEELQAKSTETDTTSHDNVETGSSVGVVTEIESSEETLEKTIEASNTENEQVSQDQEDYYTVEKGDTLATISMKKYGNKDMVEKICELNKIENDDKLKEGQKLLLP